MRHQPCAAAPPEERQPAPAAPPAIDRSFQDRIAALVRATESGGGQDEDDGTLPRAVRRLLFVIGSNPRIRSRDVVALTGIDKAQVSRGLAMLQRAGLIARVASRSDIALSGAGETLFASMLHTAAAWHAGVLDGVEWRQAKRFCRLTARLIGYAAWQEADDGPSAARDAAPQFAAIHPPSAIPPDHQGEIVAPDLETLLMHMRRGRALMLRQAFGLARFEGEILLMLTPDPQAALAELVTRAGRNKSQVGRAIASLETKELVCSVRAGRKLMIRLSDAGGRTARIAADRDREREARLFGMLGAGDRAFYDTMLDRLTAGAGRVRRPSESFIGAQENEAERC